MGPDPRSSSPIWSALTTTHPSFALGNDLARRYPPDISPMAAVRDVSQAVSGQPTRRLDRGYEVGKVALQSLTAVIDEGADQHTFHASVIPCTAKPGGAHRWRE